MEVKQDGSLPPVAVHGDARQGAKQFQEDSFFWWTSPTGNVVVGGVYDGHGGSNGAVSSQTCRLYSLQYFDSVKEECETWSVEVWSQKLESLFEFLHNTIREKFLAEQGVKRQVDEKGIVRLPSGDPVHGGTTASVAVLLRPKSADEGVTIISANVGDSTTLLIPQTGKFDFLTVDHGPENRDEYIRVQKLDPVQHPEKLLYVYDKANVFRKYECPLVFLEDGTRDPTFVRNPWGNGLHPTNVRYEPAVYAVTPRVISRDTTCIAMTRALGDFYAHQFGLTYQPSITVQKVPKDAGRITVVVGSDGIWDCWKYEEFSEYINDKLDKNPKVEAVVEQALNFSIEKAVANFGSKHYDDASLVLLVYHPQ